MEKRACKRCGKVVRWWWGGRYSFHRCVVPPVWYNIRTVKDHTKVDVWNCPFCDALVNNAACTCGAMLRPLEASKRFPFQKEKGQECR